MVSKSQSAMEYLMTYGWALLIIAFALIGLIGLGVFNANSLSPRASAGSCSVTRPVKGPNGPLITTSVNLQGVCNNELPQYVGSFNALSGSYVKVSNPSWKAQTSYFTISAWINSPFTQGETMRFVNDISNTGYSTYAGINLMWTGTSISYETGNGISDIQLTWTPSPALSGSAWYNIIVVSSPAGKYIYLNGVQEAFSASTAQSIFVPSANFCIGSWCGSNYVDGSIANVQVYNTSFSSNDAATLYDEGIGGAPIALQWLVGWWPLNSNANDYSGNSNNGNAINMAYSDTWTSIYVAPP